MLDKKKLYLPVALQCLDSFSKSNISPMGVPHPANTHSWRLNLGSAWLPRIGARSKLGASPATAANCWSHNQRTIPSVASTPLKSGLGRCGSCSRSLSFRLLYAAVNPLRMKRISPFWNSRLWSLITCLSCSRVMASDCNAETWTEFDVAHSAKSSRTPRPVMPPFSATAGIVLSNCVLWKREVCYVLCMPITSEFSISSVVCPL